MATDRQGKRHEPLSGDTESVSGGGAKVRAVTLVVTFGLPQKDIASIVVQQAKEPEPPSKSAEPQPELPSAVAQNTVAPQSPQNASPQQASQDLSHIGPLDVLNIQAIGTLLDQPIGGFFLVEPDGRVALGPAYGRVDVNGLTMEQAEQKITQQISKIVTGPSVQVTLAMKQLTLRERAEFPRLPYAIRPLDVLCVAVTERSWTSRLTASFWSRLAERSPWDPRMAAPRLTA